MNMCDEQIKNISEALYKPFISFTCTKEWSHFILDELTFGLWWCLYIIIQVYFLITINPKRQDENKQRAMQFILLFINYSENDSYHNNNSNNKRTRMHINFDKRAGTSDSSTFIFWYRQTHTILNQMVHHSMHTVHCTVCSALCILHAYWVLLPSICIPPILIGRVSLYAAHFALMNETKRSEIAKIKRFTCILTSCLRCQQQ